MSSYRIFRGKYTAQIGSLKETIVDPIHIRVAATDKYWLWLNGNLVVFAGGVNRGPTPDDSYFDTLNIRPYMQIGNNLFTVLVQTFDRESGNLNPARALSQADAASDSNDLKGGLYIDCIENALKHNVEDIRTEAAGGGPGNGVAWKVTDFTNFVAPSSDDANETFLERDTKFDLGGTFGTLRWDPYVDSLDTDWIWDWDYDDNSWTTPTEHGAPTIFSTDATAAPTGDALWFGRLHERDIPIIPATNRSGYVDIRDVTALTLTYPTYANPATGVSFFIPWLPYYATGNKQIAFKLDQNKMFVPGFTAKGTAGDVITIYTNQIDTGDTALAPTAGHYFKYEVVLGLEETEESWEAPNAFNGDWVIYDLPTGVTLTDTWYRHAGYQTVRSGSFACNDQDVENTITKAFNTLEAIIIDTPVDNPDRNRLQTPGEGMTIMNSAYYGWEYSSIHPLNRKMLRAFHYWYNHGPGEGADVATVAPYTELNGAAAIKRDPEFRMRDAAPAGPNYTALTVDDTSAAAQLTIAGESISYEIPSMVLATFGEQGLWRYYLQTGDIETITLLFDDIDDYLRSFKNGVSTVAGQLDTNDLVFTKGERTRASGDYSDTFNKEWYDWYDTRAGTPQSGLWGGNANASEADWELLNTAWWYMCVKAWRAIAVEIGQDGIHANYGPYGTAMTDIEAVFAGASLWNSGHSENAYKSTAFTDPACQRANGLLALAGLVPTSRYANIRDLLWQDSAYAPIGGIWAESWILAALYKMGYATEAIKRLKQRFDTDHGLTSDWRTVLPEYWEGAAKGSHSQGWGSFLVETAGRWIAGIEPTSPGYLAYTVRPRPGSLTTFEYTMDTVKGPITVEFEEVDGDTNHFRFVVLAGSTGTLIVDRDTADDEQLLSGLGASAFTLWDDTTGVNVNNPAEYSLTVNATDVEIEYNNTTQTDVTIEIRYEHQVGVTPGVPKTVQLAHKPGIIYTPHRGINSQWSQIANFPIADVGYMRSNTFGWEGVPLTTKWADLDDQNPANRTANFDAQIGFALDNMAIGNPSTGINENELAGNGDIKTFSLRILAENPHWNDGIPGWIASQLASRTVTSTAGTHTLFVIDNPVYLTAFTAFLQALKDYIDGHDNGHLVDSIDISGVGWAGEWHYFVAGQDWNDDLPSVSFCKSIIDAYFDVFKPGGAKDIELIANFGMHNVHGQNTDHGHELIKYACLDKAAGAGWRQDGFGNCPKMNEYETMYSEVAGMENVWQSHPVIFEAWGVIKFWADPVWRAANNVGGCSPIAGYSVSTLGDLFDFMNKRHHASHFFPLNSAIDGYDATPGMELRKAIEHGRDDTTGGGQEYMGYRLYVNQASYHATASAGSSVTFHCNVENVGSAPNYSTYETYKLHVRVGNMTGSATIPQLQPGTVSTVSVVVANLEVGVDKKVLIRARTVRRNCEVELANQNDEGAGLVHEYNVGTITVT